MRNSAKQPSTTYNHEPVFSKSFLNLSFLLQSFLSKRFRLSTFLFLIQWNHVNQSCVFNFPDANPATICYDIHFPKVHITANLGRDSRRVEGIPETVWRRRVIPVEMRWRSCFARRPSVALCTGPTRYQFPKTISRNTRQRCTSDRPVLMPEV